VEKRDYSYLSEEYFEGDNMICIQYAKINKDFDEIKFKKLAGKQISYLKMKDAYRYSFKFMKSLIKNIEKFKDETKFD
jgi:hypothetical protein